MQKTIAEYCSNCETEMIIKCDPEKDGYKTTCPSCGDRLMMCSECQFRNDGQYTDDCDYDAKTNSCQFSGLVNTCISCGAVIPEGRQVCKACEIKAGVV